MLMYIISVGVDHYTTNILVHYVKYLEQFQQT